MNLGPFGTSCPTSPSKENKQFRWCYTEFIDNIGKEKSEFIWPTIKEFTREEGAARIDEYLSSFYTDENWMYVMYYKGVKENCSVSAHKYQVGIVYVIVLVFNQSFAGYVQFTDVEISGGPSHCKCIFRY